MKAVVFANADITDYSFCTEYIKDAVIICCDGGMRHAMKLGITPDYIRIVCEAQYGTVR